MYIYFQLDYIITELKTSLIMSIAEYHPFIFLQIFNLDNEMIYIKKSDSYLLEHKMEERLDGVLCN